MPHGVIHPESRLGSRSRWERKDSLHAQDPLMNRNDSQPLRDALIRRSMEARLDNNAAVAAQRILVDVGGGALLIDVV